MSDPTDMKRPLPKTLEQAIAMYKDAGGDETFYVVSQAYVDKLVAAERAEAVKLRDAYIQAQDRRIAGLEQELKVVRDFFKNFSAVDD
jgi:hypothetical protein